MIERKPVLTACVLLGLTLASCGDRTGASGGSGATGLASEEPIDAVPLPLDDNPLSPPPPVAVAAPETKAAVVAEETSTAEPATAAAPGAPVDPSAKPPRIVVAPREPTRPVERPVERPAERPVERPAPPPALEKEGDKPVLNF